MIKIWNVPEITPTPAATKILRSVEGPVRRKPCLRPMARRKKENFNRQFDCEEEDDI
jgi:hypothetical protein